MGRTQSWCGGLLCFMWVLNCIDPQSLNHKTTQPHNHTHSHTSTRQHTYLALAQNGSCHRVLEAPISGTHGPPHFLEHNMVESAWSTTTHKPKPNTVLVQRHTSGIKNQRTGSMAAIAPGSSTADTWLHTVTTPWPPATTHKHTNLLVSPQP